MNNNLARIFIPSLIFFVLLLITGGQQSETSTTTDPPEPDHDNGTVDTITLENKLSLTYGSLLNADCSTNDDCILKNSICNSYTKRCECDYNAVHTDNRCQTIRCTTNEDCRSRFDNTICVFGSCRCKLGLSANGRCVDLDLPGLGGSKSMPDWAITLIAVGALISGIYGGRSQFVGQIVRQLLSIVLLVLRVSTMNNNRNNNGNGSNDAQQQIIDELSSVMTNNNNSFSSNTERKQSGHTVDDSNWNKHNKSSTNNNSKDDPPQLI